MAPVIGIAIAVVGVLFIFWHLRVILVVHWCLLVVLIAIFYFSVSKLFAKTFWRFHRWIGMKVMKLLIVYVLGPRSVAIVGALATGFSITETYWGKTWSIFVNNQEEVGWVKLCLWAILLLIALGSIVRENRKENSLVETEKLLSEFIRMVTHIVQNKIDALRECAKKVPSKKTLHHVCRPDDQIKRIISESARFLAAVFRLEDDQLDITILQRKGAEKWSFPFAHHRTWKHGDPENLFAGVATGSTAAAVIASGEPLFFASKKIAAEDGYYRIGDRDGSDGSIYCAPVMLDCNGLKWEFVVSIVTYGERFCNPYDDANEKKTKVLLAEIVRRLQLELYVRAIVLANPHNEAAHQN